MDREAKFLELFNDGQGRWLAIARSYAGNDAEDLFQEILLQIWRSLSHFRGESTVRTWCYRVALNTDMNWKRSTRSRRHWLPIHDSYDSASIPAASSARDSISKIHELLAEQTPADRAILLLLLDNVSYSEMAEILGTTEGTLRVRIHRMKERIRQNGKGLFDEL